MKIKMEITGLYDMCNYIDWDNNKQPVILLFTRNKDKEKEIIPIPNFKPYIYTTMNSYTKNYHLVEQYEDNFEKVDLPIVQTTEGEKEEVIKLYLKSPYDAYKLKDILKTYEGDISYTNRFVIDNIDKLNTTDYRVNYFDIETTSDQGFPDYKNPVENIISIAAFDSYYNQPYLWIWHDKYTSEKLEKEIEGDKVKVRRFKDEKEMLNDFLDFIQRTQPDYMAGWHVLFDINYLAARIEFLKLDLNKMSPLYNSEFTKKFFYKDELHLTRWKQNSGMFGKRMAKDIEERTIGITGLQYFDLLSAYKNIVASEEPSWKLDDIAKKELGVSKLRTHFDIGAKWREDPQFIEDYNYVDTILLKKLDDKIKILNRYNAIKDSVFLHNINDVFSSGKVLDNYILKKNKGKLIFPTKTFVEDRDTRIGGGFVRETKAGIYKNIAVFDFSGFYPNLMKTFNLSGEKLVKQEILFFDPKVDEDLDIEHLKQDKLYDYDENKKEITYKINTCKFKANLTYKLDTPGVMTEAVSELMRLRNEAKKEMNKFEYGSLEYEQLYKAQFSYKFLINAAYGTSAYAGFRLFQLHNANAITAIARMMSKWVSYNLIQKGWNIIYNDTDSAFIQLHSVELEDNLKETEELNGVIKGFINEFVRKFLPEEQAVKHTLKMDTEKIYKTFMLLDVKKRYLGILKYFEGKPVNKFHYIGVDMKKSNTIVVCKDALKELSLAILEERDIREVMEKYYKILKSSQDIDFFKIPSKLERAQDAYVSKTPAVRASLWSNQKLGTKFRQGTKFYIIWVKNLDTEVVAFEDKNQLLKIMNLVLDKDKYIEDLYNKFDNLVRGIPWIKQINEDCYLKYKLNQGTLQKWF